MLLDVGRRSAISLTQLTAETVQGATLTFQRVDDVHSGHSLPLGVFGVGDGIADDVFQEDLQYASRLLVNETGDTFDAAATGETPDRRFGDALDVIAENFAMTLGTSLSQSFSSFAASGHLWLYLVWSNAVETSETVCLRGRA